jgi:large subunit ribosomal protein L31
MKKKIHPDYHEITVKLTDGSEFKTCSTWGKKGDVLQLDTDILNHSAWTGGKNRINEKAGNVAKFNQRFAGINLTSAASKVVANAGPTQVKEKKVKENAKPADKKKKK